MTGGGKGRALLVGVGLLGAMYAAWSYWSTPDGTSGSNRSGGGTDGEGGSGDDSTVTQPGGVTGAVSGYVQAQYDYYTGIYDSVTGYASGLYEETFGGEE